FPRPPSTPPPSPARPPPLPRLPARPPGPARGLSAGERVVVVVASWCPSPGFRRLEVGSAPLAALSLPGFPPGAQPVPGPSPPSGPPGSAVRNEPNPPPGRPRTGNGKNEPNMRSDHISVPVFARKNEPTGQCVIRAKLNGSSARHAGV